MAKEIICIVPSQYWVEANITNGWLADFGKNEGAHPMMCELFESPFTRESEWCLSKDEKRKLSQSNQDPIAMLAISPNEQNNAVFDVHYFSDAITDRQKNVATGVSFKEAERIVRNEMARPDSFCDIFPSEI